MRLPLLTRPSGPLLGAISVVAVGVGLAAMVFALADPVLRRLPYAAPDRLVSISFGLPTPGLNSPGDGPSLTSWQARTDLFEDVAAFEDKGWLRVRLSDRMVPLRAVAVTDNLLELLGLQSRFAESDPAAAWVSRRVATTLSGGELQPGRSALIVPDGVLRVRSILPDSFLLPEINRTEPVDALTVLPIGPVITIQRTTSHAPNLVARLRPGVTLPMVEAALNVSMAPVGRRVSVVPLSTALNARLRGFAIGAMLASGLVVLVCWTNVFGMAVTRGLYRAPEIVTRTALGATPSRIVALLAEDALRVAAFGSVAALAVTWFVLGATLPALPAQFATLGAPSVTTRVVLFVVVGGVVSGGSWCVAALLAWKLGAGRRALHIVSRDGGTIRIVRFVLTAGQLGAASVLLVASALLGRSYLNLMSVDSGLDERTQTLTVSHDRNIPVALRRDLVERTLMALRRAGGVAAAGASGSTLLDSRPHLGGVGIIDGRMVVLDWTYVAGDYFNAMGLQFIAGGPPTSGDADAVVITEGAARELFGGRPAVGAVLSPRDLRIVGVVRDVRSRSLSMRPFPGGYVPAGGWGGSEPQTTYVLRVADNSATLASWERIVRGVDPMAVILDGGSIRARLDRSVRDRTFATLVIGLFALSSLLVAALGLAGVVAYTVVRRTREIAIRLVLGATIESVTSLVVRDALTAATCGVVVGVIASVWLSRALESLLYGIPAADPMTLSLTAASLLGAVLAAATLPGIRAGHIAPASALRIE